MRWISPRNSGAKEIHLTNVTQSADRVWWASRPIDTLRPFEMGHSGFDIGAYVHQSLQVHSAFMGRDPVNYHTLLMMFSFRWYLNRSAAYLAGITGMSALLL